MSRPLIALLIAWVAAETVAVAQRKPLGEEPAAVAYTNVADAGKPFELAEGFELIRPQGAAANLGSAQPLLLADGRLFAAVLDGGAVKGTFSTDRGRSWSEPQLVDKHPDENVKPGRPASIQLRDGTIWVFYFGYVKFNPKAPAGESESDVWGIRSTDGGRTWTDRTRVYDGYVGMLQGAIQTGSGHILVPICQYHEPTRFVGGCAVSRDGGKTWSFSGPVDIGPEADARQRNPYNGGALEPTIVELRDGRILMLLRTITGRMWRCESSDEGLTWSKPQPSDISCGGTIYITRLLSGRLALVWNPANWDAPQAKAKGYPHGYGNAAIALSDDDGATWTTPIHFARSERTVHSLITNTGKHGPLLLTLPSRTALLHLDEESLLKPRTAAPATKPAAAAAVDVGDAAQLFVDRSLVAHALGVEFTPQPATKHPTPLITADRPWEKYIALYGDVKYDESDQLFKMWYVAGVPAGAFTYNGEAFTAQATCYATSRDGITWEKPSVGTLESPKFPGHNVVAPVQAPLVFKEPQEPDPARRYKLVGVSRLASNVRPRHPTDTFTSPDGLRWSAHGRDIHNGTQDDVHGFYDARLKRYVVFPKQWPYPQARGHKRRVWGMISSGDFTNWTRPQYTFGADEQDDALVTQRLDAVRDHFEYRDNHPYRNPRADVYGMSLYPHESGRTLIFPWIFYYHRGFEDPRELRDEGTSEIQVATLADDNTRWIRESRRPVLSCGPWGAWDSGWLMAASELLRVGDEVWLYYDGGNFTHGFNPKWFDEPRTITRADGKAYTWTYERQIGLAKWKLDRFVAAEAGAAGGTLTTVPVTFSGPNLQLNARVRDGGGIAVELLDEAGNAMEEFGRSDEITGDGLRLPVAFAAGDCAALIGRPVTLRFHLRDAHLYSFAFRP